MGLLEIHALFRPRSFMRRPQWLYAMLSEGILLGRRSSSGSRSSRVFFELPDLPTTILEAARGSSWRLHRQQDHLGGPIVSKMLAKPCLPVANVAGDQEGHLSVAPQGHF